MLATQIFLQPLPLWNVWYVLALPLCAGVAVVYKSIRARSMRSVPWEATRATLWIVLSLIAAAALLLVIVRGMEWAKN